jgi:hypothetical protein
MIRSGTRGFDSHPLTPPPGGVSTVAPHVALHRVSIRTLEELSCCKLGAGWGSREEPVLLFIGRSQRTKTRTQSSEHGVVATGKHRHRSSGYGIERHVRFLCGPEAVEQNSQLASNSHDGLTLSLLAASGS